MEENKFVKAESLKVQISEKRFYALNYNQAIEVVREVFKSLKTHKIKEQKVFVISKKYDSDYGLLFEEDENIQFDGNQYL